MTTRRDFNLILTIFNLQNNVVTNTNISLDENGFDIDMLSGCRIHIYMVKFFFHIASKVPLPIKETSMAEIFMNL